MWLWAIVCQLLIYSTVLSPLSSYTHNSVNSSLSSLKYTSSFTAFVFPLGFSSCSATSGDTLFLSPFLLLFFQFMSQKIIITKNVQMHINLIRMNYCRIFLWCSWGFCDVSGVNYRWSFIIMICYSSVMNSPLVCFKINAWNSK